MDSLLLYLQPSKEIHLARHPAGADSQQLFLTFRNAANRRTSLGWDYELEPVILNSSMIQITQGTASAVLIDFDPVTHEIKIKPGTTTVGVNNLRIRYTHNPGGGGSPVTHEINASVHVHNRLDEWWFGIDNMTIPRDDLTDTNTVTPTLWMHHAQVSVYAHFDRVAANPNDVVSVGDITGHDYISLRIKTLGPNQVASMSLRYHGWIRGERLGSDFIRGEFPTGTVKEIPIEVINFYGNPTTKNDVSTISETNPICRRVHNRTANPDESTNILFLAEGFDSNHQNLFDTLVRKIVRRFFTPRYKPFNHLRNDIIIWKAFTPSPAGELGLTTNLYRSASNSVTSSGASITGNEILKQATNSFFGLYYPKRPSDPVLTNAFHVSGDPRRYPLEMDYHNCLIRFIATLAEHGNATNRIGRFWFKQDGSYGKDVGFVFIIHYSSPTINREGNYGHFIPTLFRADNLNNAQFQLNPAIGMGNNSAPLRVKTIIPDVRTHSQIRTQLKNSLIAEITDTVAHEIGHSFVLGDEYENGGNNNTFTHFDNISSHRFILHGSAANMQIDPQLLKWRPLHRIRKADRIITASFNHSNINNIKLTISIKAGNIRRWRVGESVFIREFQTRNLTARTAYAGVEMDLPFFRILPVLSNTSAGESPLTLFSNVAITAISGNKLEVSIQAVNLPTHLSTLSTANLRAALDNMNLVNGAIYVPKKKQNGTPLHLIDEEIVSFMTNGNPSQTPNPTHQPLSSNQSNCNNVNNNPDSPPAHAINISGGRRRFPRNSFEVIGAYEGGEHGVCQNYRPTGFCKMRSAEDKTITTPANRRITYRSKFCHVCQYLIVMRVNPERLSNVENDYPRFR